MDTSPLRSTLAVYSITLGAALSLSLVGAALIGLAQTSADNTFANNLWWAINTVSMVGFGDITPTDITGRSAAAALILLAMLLRPTACGVLLRRLPPRCNLMYVLSGSVLMTMLLALLTAGVMIWVEPGMFCGPEYDGSCGEADLGIAVYWAVVTLSSVGYGDLYPRTEAGRGVASLFILLSVPLHSVVVAFTCSSLMPVMMPTVTPIVAIDGQERTISAKHTNTMPHVV